MQGIEWLNMFQPHGLDLGLATLTALVVSFMLGTPMIRLLRSQQNEGQPIRLDGPESHPLTKKGTPTMGGFLILIALSTATLLWADLTNRYVWAVLLVTLGDGAIGWRRISGMRLTAWRRTWCTCIFWRTTRSRRSTCRVRSS